MLYICADSLHLLFIICIEFVHHHYYLSITYYGYTYTDMGTCFLELYMCTLVRECALFPVTIIFY